MPQHKKVQKLYKQCVEFNYRNLLTFCENLEQSPITDKHSILIRYKHFLLEQLPRCVLNDILLCNSRSDEATASALIQYYFFQILTHDRVTKFRGKYIELNVSYWKCLFEPNFSVLKKLNLALCCSDPILELIPKYCPQLEYLNATSKYLFRDAPKFNGNSHRMQQLPVSDAGLSHLQACKKLRVLVVNEPRGEYPIATNQITYNGLRFLLRNVATLEDISYSDIGHVITTKFSDVDSLNLNVIRHIHPTAATLREIFRLCKNVKQLNLICSNSDTSTSIAKELCAAQQTFSDIEFQNISFGDYFNDFFIKFGPNLVSISLSHSQEELNFNHIVAISISCPNIRFLLCFHLSNEYGALIERPKYMRQFSQLKSLYLSGCNIEIEKLLRYCTEYASNLEILKVHELVSVRNVDEMLLKCVNSKNLRQLELSRLLCSKVGIENIIDKYAKLNFLIVQCLEDCNDLVARIASRNYHFTLIIKRTDSNPFS